MKNTTNNKWWMTYLLLTAGTFFMAVGINVIYEPLSMVRDRNSCEKINADGKVVRDSGWNDDPFAEYPIVYLGVQPEGKSLCEKDGLCRELFLIFPADHSDV